MYGMPLSDRTPDKEDETSQDDSSQEESSNDDSSSSDDEESSGITLFIILLRTTCEGKTVNWLIRGKPGDSCVCVSKGAAQCVPCVWP